MEDYENKFRISHNLRGRRQRNKVWMEMHVSQPKAGPLLTSTTVSGLLDVGRSIHLLTGVEATFDKDQCGERRHLLTTYIQMKKEAMQTKQQEEELLQSYYCS